MFTLVIVPFAYMYKVQLRRIASDVDTIVFMTECSELDLQETIEKVLRVSKNLRIIPE